MINLMVCDLFMFLNIKNNPKVNCLFHTLRPIAGFTLGFSVWGLLWVLRRREALINDGVGNVYRWDSYAETAAFSMYLFYCFTKHDDKYVEFLGVGLVVCWGFSSGFFFFLLLLLLLSFAIIHFAHSGFCPSLQQKHSSPATLLVRFTLYLSGELLFEQRHQNVM